MAINWQGLTELATTPEADDEVLVKDTSDTTDDAVGTVKRNSITNLLSSRLPLAGGTIVGEIALGSGGSINDAGPITASGSLTRVTHGGRWVVTSGNVTVPNASGDVGMGGVIEAGGAHTITFNSTACAALTTGDVVTYYVKSTTAIYAVKSAVASKLAFS